MLNVIIYGTVFLLRISLGICLNWSRSANCTDAAGTLTPCKQVRLLVGAFKSRAGRVGYPMLMGLRHTIDEINRWQKLLPGYNVIIDEFDTKYNKDDGLSGYKEHAGSDRSKYAMYIGGDSTSVVEVGTIAPVLHMPYVGWNKNPQAMQRNILTSYFNCYGLPGLTTYPSALEIIRDAGWKHIGLIDATNEAPVSHDLRAKIKKDLAFLDVIVTEWTYEEGGKNPSKANIDDMRRTIRGLKDMQLNVLVFTGAYLPRFLCAMAVEKVGAVTIIFLDFLNSVTFTRDLTFPKEYQSDCTIENLVRASSNLIGFEILDTKKKLTCLGITMEQLSIWWLAKKQEALQDPDILAHTSTLLDGYARYGHDTACIVAKGLQDLLFRLNYTTEDLHYPNMSTFRHILESLQNVRFEASFGKFEFVQNAAVPVTQINLVQMKNRSSADISNYYRPLPTDGFYSSSNGAVTNEGLLSYIDWSDWRGGAVPEDRFNFCPDGTQRIWGECTICPPGYFQVSAIHHGVCTRCAVGLYRSSSMSAADCRSCERGRFNNETGSSACSLCEPGHFASDVASISCTSCQPGTFQDISGQSLCTSCEKGFVSEDAGAITCEQCPVGKTTLEIRADSVDGCQCPQESYMTKHEACKKCPDGLICAWGSVAFILHGASTFNGSLPLVKEGYWTDPSSPLSVYRCGVGSESSVCVGGTPGSCAEGGRFGFLCASCGSGSIISGKRCAICSAWNNVILQLLGVVACITLVFAYYSCNSQLLVNSTANEVILQIFGMGVTLLQVFGMFSYLSVPWEKSEPCRRALGPTTIFVAGLQAFGLECTVGTDPVVHYAVMVSQPFLIALYLWICHIFSHFLASNCSCCKGWDWCKTLNTLGSVYNAVFITLAAACASPAQLFRHPNDMLSVIRYPQVLTVDNAFKAQVAFAVCCVCAFLAPFTSLCLWGIRAVAGYVPHAVGEEWCEATRQLKRGYDAHVLFRFMVYRFRPGCWWWGTVFLFRQLCLAFAPVLPAEEPHAQAIFVSSILTLYAVLAASYHPWKSNTSNILDLMFCFGLSIVILTATSFMDPSRNLRTFYTWVIFSSVAAMSASLFIAMASTLFTMCWYGWGAAAETAIPTQGPPEDLSKLWSRVCTVCAQIPIEKLHALICRMSLYDWNALEQSTGAWHALAPNMFPSYSVNRHRLIALEHSISSREGFTTIQVVESIKEHLAEMKKSGIGIETLCPGQYSESSGVTQSVKVKVEVLPHVPNTKITL